MPHNHEKPQQEEDFSAVKADKLTVQDVEDFRRAHDIENKTPYEKLEIFVEMLKHPDNIALSNVNIQEMMSIYDQLMGESMPLDEATNNLLDNSNATVISTKEFIEIIESISQFENRVNEQLTNSDVIERAKEITEPAERFKFIKGELLSGDLKDFGELSLHELAYIYDQIFGEGKFQSDFSKINEGVDLEAEIEESKESGKKESIDDLFQRLEIGEDVAI